MLEDAGIEIDKLAENGREGLFRLGRELFDCPELGFKEVKSNQILTSFLRHNSIDFVTGLALTGIKATLGTGGYHVALVADMDALPLLENGGAIHSCGHSIQTAVMAYALKLLKDSGLVDRAGGRVSFVAAPAEEFIDFSYRRRLVKEGKIRYLSGKQNMISEGVFDDVDCVISIHINGEQDTLFDVDSTLTGFAVRKVTFLGEASHSGAAPHMGRNALCGVNLCLNGVAFLKDHFPADAGLSLHPVVTQVGGGVNIIPDRAVMETYIRANTMETIMEAGRQFDDCAFHCAKALGLECEIERTAGYLPFVQSKEINDLVYRHMLELCDDSQIVKHVVSGASGDIGDLGFLLPAVQLGFSGVTGRIHSSNFAIRDESHVYMDTVKVVAKTVADLLSNPRLQVKNHAYQEKKAFYLKNWLQEP